MTDEELYKLCQEYGRKALIWKRRFVALLPEVYRRHLYRRKGYGSIFEFAAKLGGVSRGIVEEVIRVDEKLKEMPMLKEKIAEVGLSKIRKVVSVATKETETEWAEKVSTMTKSALETHIKDFRPGPGIPATPQESLFDNSYETFTVKLEPEMIAKLKHLKANMKEGSTWNDVFKELFEGKKLKKQRARNLKAEAQMICEAEGCNQPATVIHHTERYALTGDHKKLQSLCKAHHELAHRGYLDEQAGMRPLINAIIDPIKAAIDRKMLFYLRGS